MQKPHASISNRASNCRRGKYLIMLLHTSQHLFQNTFFLFYRWQETHKASRSSPRSLRSGPAWSNQSTSLGVICCVHTTLHLWFLSNFYLLHTQVTETWLRILKSGVKRILFKGILQIKVKQRGILESHWQDNVFCTHFPCAHFFLLDKTLLETEVLIFLSIFITAKIAR